MRKRKIRHGFLKNALLPSEDGKKHGVENVYYVHIETDETIANLRNEITKFLEEKENKTWLP